MKKIEKIKEMTIKDDFRAFVKLLHLDRDDYKTMMEYIEELSPAAQPERKTGHWIISSDGYYPYCSECKSEPKSGEMTDFCPSCGAKMNNK